MSEPAPNYRPYLNNDKRCEGCAHTTWNDEDRFNWCNLYQFCPDDYYICDTYKEA